MKNYLLSALVCSTLLATAQQSLIPSPYNSPVTGFRQLTDENPYMLQQQMVSGQWANFQRFTHQNAPNIDRIGENKTSQWQSNSTWKDVQIQKDSFILDGQNRIATAIEEQKYDYGQFAYQAKSKYIYTYDANDRIIKVNIMDATPANSNNFSNTWNMSLFYNPDGSRHHDSMYYYGQHESYLQYYNYNVDGSLASVIGFNNTGGDTASKTYITYLTALQIHTTISTYLDETSDTWVTQSADTFEYNAEGKATHYIAWGGIFDGTSLQFAPISNENYHYTTSGKLDEIITRTWNEGNGVWDDESKTTFIYNPQDKAVLGNMYSASGSGWESTPTYRYLFDVPTGIADVHRTKINASVYPNPAKDMITVKLENQSDKIGDIKLFDLKGKSISPVINADQTIDVSGLTNGIYSIVIVTENGASVQKVSVQH